MNGKGILLIVGGGIAAYKSCELIRLLRKAGASVRCVLTDAGARFVTPLSLQALSEDKVYTDMFSLTDESEMGHIELSREADLLVVGVASDINVRSLGEAPRDLVYEHYAQVESLPAVTFVARTRTDPAQLSQALSTAGRRVDPDLRVMQATTMTQHLAMSRLPSQIGSVLLSAFAVLGVALAAIGGSTNAVVHLLAIAGRLGIDLTIDDFDRIGSRVPVLVDLQPAGRVGTRSQARCRPTPAP